MAPLKKTFVGVLLMVLASSTLFVVVAQKKVASNERVDCSPDDLFISSDVCAKRDCIFDTENNEHVPKCYFPINTGYWANGTRESNTANGLMITTTLVKASGAGSPFGEDITSIYFETSNIGSTLSIRIGHEGRYEPQISLPRSVFHSTDNFVVEQSNRTGVFSFAVKRKSTNTSIWDTSIGDCFKQSHLRSIHIIFPITLCLANGSVLKKANERMHDMEHYTTWGMFARDQPYSSSYPIHTLPYNYPNNLYGAYPFYIALESDYNAHGVFILNSNPQEVTLGPAPHLVYRTIGGILDIFFFPGPRPEDVIRQYLAIVGTPFLPPYWAFGYQLGSDGYRNVSEIRSVISDMQNRRLYLDAISAGYEYMEKYQDFTVANLGSDGYRNVSEIRSVISDMQNRRLYLDAISAGYEYMEKYQDFTVANDWADFPEFITELHNKSINVVILIDPAFQADGETFRNALNANASFIEWERQDQVPKDIQDLYPLAKNTKIMLGVLRPDRHVAYADFSANETIMWWKDKITNFHRNFSFDGMMLSNNEPTSFDTNEAWPSYFNESDHANIMSLKCPINTNDPTNSKYDLPPYATVNVFAYTNQQQKGYLSSKTLCMLAQTKAGRLYDTKNLYGLQQSAATQIAFSQALPKRSLLMTRSSFPSAGRYAGHWLGENRAQWDDMALSVIQIQEMNMFGIPFVGANICGYHGNTTQELCFRWTQLGAFYTFSRNQNDKWSIPQEPTRWHSVANAASEVNGIRYRFLPYLYTLHYLASRYGGTVIRPVFFEFPNDEVTHRLSFQFMWGSAVLIIPVLEANKTSVYGYLPNDENWYSLRSMEYGTERPSGFQFIEAPDFMPMPIYARGGHIIPKQTPAVTTAASRKNPFELLIALRFDSTQSTDGTTLPLPSYGELYWDDGETKVENFGTHEFYHWQFSFETTEGEAILNISTMATAKFNLPTLDRIEIFGYPFVPLPTTMKFNGVLYGFNYRFSYYSEKTKTLTLRKTNFITMPTSGSLRITWAHRSAAFLKKIPSTQRITCLPDAAPVSECPFRGCIHDENLLQPSCYFSKMIGYVESTRSDKTTILVKKTEAMNPFSEDISPIYLIEQFISGTTLNIRIGANNRFEPPLNLPRNPVSSTDSLYLERSNKTGIFSFKVRRTSTKSVIWDTSIGGHIIPKQTPAVTTAASRKNPFELLIALRFDSTQSTDGTTLPLPSYGELYWDDGETKVENFGTHEFYHWQFSFETTEGEAILNISTMATAKFNLPTLDRIEIFGYPFVPLPTTMKFNGVLYGFNYRFSYYSEKTKTLTLRKTNFITMPTSGSLRITWAHRSAAFLKKIPSTQRITCLPDAAPVSECPFRGCIHDENLLQPSCYFSKMIGYVESTRSDKTTILVKKTEAMNPFSEDISPIYLIEQFISGTTLNIRIGANNRFEPPLNLPRNPVSSTDSLYLERSNKTGIFSFKVRRTSTKSVIWDTSIGGLLFGDQYIQIAAFLGSSEIYGLGENAHQRLRHELEDYRTWGMFTRNQNPPSFTGQAYDPQNLYGVHPFYIAFEDDYNAHGVFFLNSNAQEITLGPAPQLIYRTIGGILDIYFFPGPTPADVVQQYLALIGTPLLPPYWALGFQQTVIVLKETEIIQCVTISETV
ncbi:Maltase-glucoamylase, intestinal [Toxocara canis]|uniref:Maltase-glucoamylase, intestinal n=1 Tax=Toxocara canis TaxID=6265 RepID=A0A0B2W208_TOXCA|nr:Maltase-glucoamylase, intestinal [Toxocara canis]